MEELRAKVRGDLERARHAQSSADEREQLIAALTQSVDHHFGMSVGIVVEPDEPLVNLWLYFDLPRRHLQHYSRCAI